MNTAETDASLLPQRQALRRKIAERDAMYARANVLRERLTELDAEADQAADAHKETCEPIQVELQQLEESIIEAAADRRPIPDAVESRRRELLDIVQVANEQLAQVVDSVKLTRIPIQREINRLVTEAGKGAAIEFELQRLRTPEQEDRNWLLRQESQWASRRMTAARQHLDESEAGVKSAQHRKEKESEAAYRQRARRWELELGRAGQLCSEAGAALSANNAGVVNG